MADDDHLGGLTIGEPQLEGAVVKVPVSITRERARLVLGLILDLELPGGMDAAELVIELDVERLGPWCARALTNKSRRSRIEGGVVVVRTAGDRPVRQQAGEGGAG